MAYEGKDRADGELYALQVVTRLLKAPEGAVGTFYIASKKGGNTSIVCERQSKDPSGTKLLQRGRKMRVAMGNAEAFSRGLLGNKDDELLLVVTEKKGNLRALKKKLYTDLLERGTDKVANPGAARLGKLLKVARFQDESKVDDEEATEGELEETDTLDGEKVGDVTDLLLSHEELGGLGLTDEDQQELDALDEVFATDLGRLGEIFLVHDDEEAIGKAITDQKNRLEKLQQQLGKFQTAHMPQEDRERLGKLVAEQLEVISKVSRSGVDPWPDVGGVVDATHQILLQVVRAQAALLKKQRGTFTLGVEAEYGAGDPFLPATAIECPVCHANPKWVCIEPPDLLGEKSHQERWDAATIEDHSPVYILTYKGEKIVTFQFESQGTGPQNSGVLEAVSEPIDADTEEGRAKLAAIGDGIDAVAEAIASKMGDNQYIDALLAVVKFKVSDLALKVAPGMNPKLVLTCDSLEPKNPQVNVTHSLSTLCETFKKGFPDVTDEHLVKVNTAMLQDAADDAEDIVTALLEAAGVESDSDLGPSLKGLVALLVQDTQRVAFAHLPGKDKGDGWVEMPFTTREGEKVPRSFHWAKDRYALLPKTPLALLAHEGGLTPKELDLLKKHKGVLLDGLERVLKRQSKKLGRDTKVEGGTKFTLSDHVDLVLRDPPTKPKAKPPTPFPPRRPSRPDDLDYTKWSILGRDVDDEVWERDHKKAFDKWLSTNAELWKTWVPYLGWKGAQTRAWGLMVGDSGVHSITQMDDDRMRVATEYRMLDGGPDMLDIANTVLGSMNTAVVESRDSRLKDTLG